MASIGATWICIMTMAVVIVEINSLTDVDRNAINKGLEAGEALANFIQRENFPEVLSKVSSSIGSFLGTINPIIGLILTLIPVSSAQKEFRNHVKEKLKDIDNKLDKVNLRLDNIERSLEWNHVRSQLRRYETNINHMIREFKMLYDVPFSAAANRSLLFIEQCRYKYDDSGKKLFDYITTKSEYEPYLVVSIYKHTDFDRKKMQDYFRGLLRLLTQAAEINLACLSLRSFDANHNHMVNEWKERLTKVVDLFKSVDELMEKTYVQTFVADLDKFTSNGRFGKEIWDHLQKKYYWRDWLVVVYPPIRGWNKHTVSYRPMKKDPLEYSSCDGDRFFRHRGQNILIASVDKNRSYFDKYDALNEMSTVRLEKNEGRWKGTRKLEAWEIENSLSNNGACATAVIKGGDVKVYGTDRRLAKKDRYVFHSRRHNSYYERIDIIQWG